MATTLTLRVVGVPFCFSASHPGKKDVEDISRVCPLVVGNRGFSSGTHEVVTSPSLHCAKVASRIASSNPHLLSTLTLPGENPTTDSYRRVLKTKLFQQHPELKQCPGAKALHDKWWPANFTCVETQISKFLQWVHQQTARNWVVVVTHEYAVKMCRQLCATPNTSPEAGEWRTYRLPTNGPNTFVMSESYLPRAQCNEMPSDWMTRLEHYSRSYFGLVDTPFQALLKKAKSEAKAYTEYVREERRMFQTQSDLKKRRQTKWETEASICADCGADRDTNVIQDTVSGDTCCRHCGYVFEHHTLNDKGSDQRSFEGEVDKSHHSIPTSLDALLSVSSQLQTSRSKCFAAPGTHHSMSTCRLTLPSEFKVNQMMREGIDTRTHLTTQDTKDEHIRQTSALLRRLMRHPDTRVSLKVIELAERMFRYKRNSGVSLQPIGTSTTHRPKDATLSQHQAATWMAAELFLKASERLRPTHTYVPFAIVGAQTWQKKRGDATTVGRDADTSIPLIPRQAKRKYENIRPLNERAQALKAARTRRREAKAMEQQVAARDAAKAAAHAAAQAAQLLSAT